MNAYADGQKITIHEYGIWRDGTPYALATRPPIPGTWPNGADALTTGIPLAQITIHP